MHVPMAVPCVFSQMSSAKVKIFCERMVFISLQMKVAEGVDPGPRPFSNAAWQAPIPSLCGMLVYKALTYVVHKRVSGGTGPALLIKSILRTESMSSWIDSKLNWSNHAHDVCKKVNQRLYFLRKLRSFKVNSEILLLFYRATIESIITYGINCWGSSIMTKDKERINRLIRKSEKNCKKNIYTNRLLV